MHLNSPYNSEFPNSCFGGKNYGLYKMELYFVETIFSCFGCVLGHILMLCVLLCDSGSFSVYMKIIVRERSFFYSNKSKCSELKNHVVGYNLFVQIKG